MLDRAAIQFLDQTISISRRLEGDALELSRQFLTRWRLPGDYLELDITHPDSATRKVAEILEVPNLGEAQSVAEELEEHLGFA